MKKALVTGGSGFIGSNLVKKLSSQGWQVDIVDDLSNGDLAFLEDLNTQVAWESKDNDYTGHFTREPRQDNDIHILVCDFTDDLVLDRIINREYDTVFHLAANPRVEASVDQPYETTELNILKTVKLFDACRNNVKRIVFSSSSAVYGEVEVLPTIESELKSPKSPYAWHKSAIEDFSKMCYDLYKLDVVCLRYFNVYGPNQLGDSPYSTAISAWCNAIDKGLQCRSDGDGTQTRDMCYVDDVVNANILAANSGKTFKGECYNIASGDRVSNNEILEYFRIKHGADIVHSKWRPGDVMHTHADISKAKRDLGYEPMTNIWKGLKETIKWWEL